MYGSFRVENRTTNQITVETEFIYYFMISVRLAGIFNMVSRVLLLRIMGWNNKIQQKCTILGTVLKSRGENTSKVLHNFL